MSKHYIAAAIIIITLREHAGYVESIYNIIRASCSTECVGHALENIVTLLHLLRLKSNLNLIGWNFKSNLSSNFHL